MKTIISILKWLLKVALVIISIPFWIVAGFLIVIGLLFTIFALYISNFTTANYIIKELFKKIVK